MNCKKCDYIKIITNYNKRATRNHCYCNHPDKEHISDYFRKHRVCKSVGFLSFTKPYTNEPTIKTSPKWCPLKK